MNILVTGSSGFVGTNFKKNSLDFNIKEANLRNFSVSEIDLTKCDAVLHLAALVHQMQGAPEEEYFKINRDLTFELAKKAKTEGVKQFVFMSTAKVFGESTTGKPSWNEYSECKPEDAYARSKYEAEKLLLGLENENFKIAIIRSPLIYGAEVKANMFNLVKIVNKFSFLPLGGINNCRSMVYVGNLVSLLEQIIKTQASGIFIASDPEPLSTTRLVRIIADSSDRKLILFKFPYPFLKIVKFFKPSIIDRLFGSLELDNTETNRKLNFKPPYSIEYGILEMVKWHRRVSS